MTNNKKDLDDFNDDLDEASPLYHENDQYAEDIDEDEQFYYQDDND